MLLIVKQTDKPSKEFRFTKSPISIGRQTNSQIFLPDRTVSRQHAVIFSTGDGKWMIEDLDSASKTFLNDQAVHKSEIKTGDKLRITEFTIDINLEENAAAEQPLHLDDTLATPTRSPQIIVRKPDAEHAPAIRFPGKRAADFLKATQILRDCKSLDQLVLTLLDIVSKQFDTFNAWCALRSQPAGPMTCHAGRNRGGGDVGLNDIELNKKITEALEKDQFLLFLFSRTPDQDQRGKIRSALIAPMMGINGCFGAIYADNAIGDEHYSLSDLDYLMLLVIHATAILQGLPA